VVGERESRNDLVGVPGLEEPLGRAAYAESREPSQRHFAAHASRSEARERAI
jgi:hypothetical protein